MKNSAKTTKTPRRTRTALLTQRDLAAAVGGHNGTIIVENAVPGGIQGSGLLGISGGA